MSERPAVEPSALDRLLARLRPEALPDDVFLGGAGVGGVTVPDRLYGGLVAAQATLAAASSVEDKPLHSLHAYFLRPGRPDRPIRYEVDRIKQGRNFHARRVTARQDDQRIFELLASFSRPREGVRHQATMPEVPDPDAAPSRDRLRGRPDWESIPVDVRMCDPIAEGEAQDPHKRVWMRPRGEMPDDALLHLGMLVYASDRTLLRTAWRPHADRGEMSGASLDHALWLHEPPRFDDWHLFTMESPVASSGRGLVVAGVYRRDGARVATVVQEGVL